ncbi:hypothetical protein ACFWHB_08205 [Aeromonas mytilicola subsp. aquatica]|uniref:hypothetical protein n=1 Tax=Aeromonas mytilicola TaxID=3377113 RepID=UPI0037BF69E5
MRKLIDFIRSMAKYSWQFFSVGVLTTLAVLGYFYDFKSPRLELEITSIYNGNNEPVDLVKENGIPTIKSLFKGREVDFDMPISYERYILSQDDINRRILIFKSENVERAKKIKEFEDKFYEYRKLSESEEKIDKLKSLYDDEMGLRSSLSLFSLIRGGKRSDEQLTVEEMIDGIETLVSEEKDKLSKLDKKIRAMDSEWVEYKTNTLPKKSKLTVSVAIGNTGDGATSLKPQALFRADLGGGNYLDFPMRLKGYEQGEDNASFQPKTYKVVRFESEEVGAMTEADRERFKMFLGNASPATLFVSDVKGNNYFSNPVPFSPGVYEQKAYDLLKKYASDQYGNKS